MCAVMYYAPAAFSAGIKCWHCRISYLLLIKYFFCFQQRSDNNGELLFSLSFNPDTRTLVVNVLKAKDLILPDMEGTGKKTLMLLVMMVQV